MANTVYAWLATHYVEVLGSVLGLVYIFLSIKQHIFTWPVGLITSALYVYVFLESKFYADMLLQVYYVGVSIYGWYHWLKGNPNSTGQLKVMRTPKELYLPLVLVTTALFAIFLFGLKYYTDSPVPYGDSLTTAMSIVATWMLARKYIEHWLIWIFVDAFSAVLYGFKDLWPTVILFVVYTVMAAMGYRSWKNDLIKQHG
ncbi:nicotinamide riboside transporter PnuC [uncultured Sunxiuqinia sp.]|uniref:nicotinamide riboside transporter PnuC n=1 Tax=uncultured Sunxiuqinia sp. TaxID=1573825 RepID=UPI002AA70024|nr:nicotinamide riboside transporter PnuC [uncultured Sunxiuqinia sp.]